MLLSVLAHWCGSMSPLQLGVAALVIYVTYRLLSRPARHDQHYVVKRVPEELTVVGRPTLPEMDEIGTLVQEMRACFDAGITRPVSKRIEQLKACHRMFVENEQQFVDALKQDLSRPFFEALFYDILLPVNEIEHLISHVEEWSAPERKGFNLLTFPGSPYVYKEPLGVVLVIGTWNYPIMLTMVPVVGAIAAGNTVVLKPCNVSSASANLLATLIPRYLDPHVCSVVGTNLEGDRNTTAELLRHKFDHIFFTGSPSVGRVVMRGAAEHLTPVTLELGGKNPVFVAEDADLDLAAKRTVWGRNMNAGQQCISPDYVLCHEAVIDKFLERAKYWCETLYGADPMNNGNFGRIVGDKQVERLVELLKSHGGEVVCGGTWSERDRFIAPTVLRVGMESPMMEEETFGPILLVVAVKSMEDAIAYVNSRPKPLSLYLFSASKDTQEKIIYNTSSGGVTVNATLFHCAHPELPFGGIGNSGMNAYHGRQTFEIFCHKKPVLHKSVWPDGGALSDPFFLYPPWSDLKAKILRALMKLV